MFLITPSNEVVVHDGPLERFGIVAPELDGGVTSLFRAWDGLPGSIVAIAPPDQERITCALRPTRADLMEFYRAGFALHLRDAARWIPSLGALCRQLEDELDLRAGSIVANIVCTASGAVTRPRADVTDAVLIQFAGEQRWSFSANTAQPGTMIFLPRGTHHSATAQTASILLSCTITHTSMTRRVRSMLQRRLARHEELRAPRLEQRDPAVANEALRKAAKELRRLARALERGAIKLGPSQDSTYRLREDITATRTGENAVHLRTPTQERSIDVDSELATILEWANGRDAFGVTELVAANALRPSSTREALRKLVRGNLLERVV